MLICHATCQPWKPFGAACCHMSKLQLMSTMDLQQLAMGQLWQTTDRLQHWLTLFDMVEHVIFGVFRTSELPHMLPKTARQQGKSWPILSTRSQSCQCPSQSLENQFQQDDHQAPATQNVHETSDMTTLDKSRGLMDQAFPQNHTELTCRTYGDKKIPDIMKQITPSSPKRHTPHTSTVDWLADKFNWQLTTSVLGVLDWPYQASCDPLVAIQEVGVNWWD